MSFLLDTNAVSEWVKPRLNPGLIGWMESADEDRIFISVVSVAELHYGVQGMAAGRRRSRLEQWLQHELPLRFESRILPVDTGVAEAWGNAVSRSEAAGRPTGASGCFPGGHSGNPSTDAGDPHRCRFSAAQSGSRSLDLKTAITNALRPPQRPPSSPA